MHRLCAIAIIQFFAASCGYQATPVNFNLVVTRDQGASESALTLLGLADPSASSFADGQMLSTRWETEQPEARVMELWLDLDTHGWPKSPDADGYAIDSVTAAKARLSHRNAEGQQTRIFDATHVAVVLWAQALEGPRTLSAGRFTLEFAMPDANLLRLDGSWQTSPAPPQAPPLVFPNDDAALPDAGPSDAWQPDAAHLGDPQPLTDPMRPPRGADDDLVSVETAGCACTGKDDTDDLPSEGDTEPWAGDPHTSTSKGDAEEDGSAGGCSCGGEDDPGGGDSDSSSDDGDVDSGGSSGGCDCEGDSPDPSDGGMRTAAAALANPHHRVIRTGVCRPNRIRTAMEFSPFILLVLRDRRRRKMPR